MAKPINLVSALRACSKDNFVSAAKWLAYTVGAGFLPLIFGLLLVWGFSHNSADYRDFIIHGEFAIYSATLVAGSARLIGRDSETGPFVHREMFILAAFLTLAVAVAVYISIKTATLLKLESMVNQEFIVWFSIRLLFFSVAFAFLVFLLDHQRFHPNVRAIAKQKEIDLVRRFNRENPDLPPAPTEEDPPGGDVVTSDDGVTDGN